ncbi:MAG: o-succinylbenzoate synthase [Acidobacteria bacterium]|nr:o-succinylbenzoate synthase [Acidobacteriota bacterium]
MQLEKLELREIRLPLIHPFETSFGRTTHRRILIIRAYDQSGAYGYGECTAPEEPFFNHETIDTAWLMISKFVSQLLAVAKIARAEQVNEALARIRGNRMAKGGVECAIWDLQARLAEQPLWRHLGGTQTIINSGVSIGLQPNLEMLLDQVDRELSAGYQRIKIKIKPGRDVQLVKAIREKHPHILLSVDANSAYTLADLEVLRELDGYNLLMIEQPLSPGDLVDHAKLQRVLQTPVCLDESIKTLNDVRHALELGSGKIINIKLGRVGGHSEARAIQAYCAERGIAVWCGGMLEAGIGRAHNIAMSTQLGFTLPGDVSASQRYWDEDIIEPAVTVSSSGTISAPEGIGLGYEVNEARLEGLVVRREMVALNS